MSRLHLYIFGSLCRGEVVPGSDADLLAIVSGGANALSREMFSIYSHARVREIWEEGNPFAWHLFHESRIVFASDGRGYIEGLGVPKPYMGRAGDCTRFFELFLGARRSLSIDYRNASAVFDLSTAFLALRNFCSCYILGKRGAFDFSRNVALRLMGDALPVPLESYRVLERARLLCTRGYGSMLTDAEVEQGRAALGPIEEWLSLMSGRLGQDE